MPPATPAPARPPTDAMIDATAERRAAAAPDAGDAAPETPEPARPLRNGAPRPLAAYLSASAASAHQAAALAATAQDPRFPWRPSLRAAGAYEGENFAEIAGAIGDAAVARAVSRETLTALKAMMDGIERYHAAPSRPRPPEAPVMWRRGGARLLDFSAVEPLTSTHRAADAPALLVLPSLINRARILDLTAGRSLMRGLARRAYVPFSSTGAIRASKNALSTSATTSESACCQRSTSSPSMRLAARSACWVTA